MLRLLIASVMPGVCAERLMLRLCRRAGGYLGWFEGILCRIYVPELQKLAHWQGDGAAGRVMRAACNVHMQLHVCCAEGFRVSR
jgi:hypothetical protein